ncbi:MAG: FAD-binding protein [Nitrosospira sp.]|nr:FAD-binding protein [Nitrosospira sp.]MDN5881561.1 FAD-binding protein [Nitrosospira sp.]MDN5935608.1 FAD-binding protein [Nitrosospira sp.]
MPDGQGRSFFRPQTLETGRHQSYEQALEGEYAFRIDRGEKPPFETYNDATSELRGIIQACVQDGKSLRARGSLWSLSTCAVTNGRLIDNKALRLAFEVPRDLTNPAYTGDAAKLRFVECGNSIAALNDYLFASGLSIKACGSNNGQTIAGALSTGTHGSAYEFGAMQEMVVGLHLIAGPNKHVYLQRQSSPVMQPVFAQSIGADFIQDDTLFNAALVSFGSFGIIHGVMIETRELFLLNAVRFRHPYDAKLKAAIDACDPTLIPLPAEANSVPRDKPYHFEIFFNPNEGTPPAEAILLVMYESAYDPDTYVAPEWQGAGESGLGASGLNVMGALLGRIPSPLNRLAVPLLNSQVNQEFSPYFKQAIIRDLFRGEQTLGKTLACGVGIPVARAVEAMEIAFKAYKDADTVLPLILSHRFVKGTKALLGFTRFDTTAILEMDAVNTPETRAFFNQVWSDLDAAGIPFTLHWGKYNVFLTPDRVRNRYGDAAVDQWLTSRETLMESAAVRQTFTNAFMTDLGLAT